MDCHTNKTIGWVIGDRSIKTAKKLYEKLKHLDAVFYVDDWDPYKQIFPRNRLVIGKKHTTLIESNNSNIRHFLARMTRRTKVVSRSVEMVDLTLRLCWNINENDFFKIFQNKFLGIFS